MAKFTYNYVAKDATGKELKGVIESGSRDDAMTMLKRQGMNPSRVDQVVESKGIFGRAARKAKSIELCLFTRQLATMLGAGIPLLESFEILAEQTRESNKGFGAGLQECADLVRGGTEISEAMAKFPRMFPDIYINMVKAGEASGQLDVILNRLADFLESAEALKSEIKSAMTYPVISLCLIFGITGYLLVGIVPKFERMFTSLNAKLPAITVIVLAASKWVTNNLLTVLVIVILSVVGYILAMKTRQGKRVKDTVFLKLPVFGPLFQKVAISRFARTFGTLLSSGVPLLQALEIVASTAGNVVIEETLLQTREYVRRGESLTSHLSTSWVFPPMVVKMMAIGEKSGALETLLGKIADFYDSQIHATVKSLTSLIEPIMLVVMGGVVGTVVLAIFMPILELQKQLS
ncbi:MAG: type II secretion system F family protein [Planctomycetes bacterium]|nr:type II secretion system F family protein [Planctomycetota bacterium]